MGTVSAVASLEVELSHRDVSLASAEVRTRPEPSPWLYMALMALVFVGAMETGLSLAFLLSQNAPIRWMVVAHQFLTMAVPALLFLLGLWSVNTWYNRAAIRRAEAQLREHGTPDSVRATYILEDAGLRLVTPRGEWLAHWHSINGVNQATMGWVIGHDLGMLLVPKTAFADAAAEQLWLREVLDRLSEKARTASAAAIAFAQGSS